MSHYEPQYSDSHDIEEEMGELLRAALFVLNAIPRRKLRHEKFTDTYQLAAAISELFRNIEGDYA